MNMQKISNPVFLDLMTKLFILLVFAKLISMAIWWFLPTEGVELETRENYKPNYQRVDFKSMLHSSAKGFSAPKQTSVISRSGTSMTNMLLKGLYGSGNHGMAIVALKSSANKTSVIAVGETFSGYRLKKVLQESVVFVKNNKEYVLRMAKQKKLSSSMISDVPVEQTVTKVSRTDINDYVANRKDIWKDIGMQAINDGGKLKGFRVNRMNKKSKVASLGLKIGDIIIAANNTKLTSMKDVMDLYKNIKTMTTLQLVVLRKSQEIEFVFDIN